MDCRYDEDLSLSSATSIIRTEDATMPCFKVLGNETGPNYAGVSQNFERARNRFQKTVTYYVIISVSYFKALPCKVIQYFWSECFLLL